MSNYKGFRTGSNSYGQFWFGGSTFPGFLYKKNLGVGGRRSTQFTPGGTTTCNQPTDLYNKYKPGGGGVGASTMSNRRAKNRLATVCLNNSCFPCYNTLGQYSNYTHNPNGFIPCPAISISISHVTPIPTLTYTVTYNGNTNTGGSAPIDSSSPYIAGYNVAVLGNTGSLVKTGYTFSGWNTASNGSGTPYNIYNIFSMPASNITLYAQWTPTYTVTYDGNTNTGGSVPVDSNSPYTYNSPVTVLGNTGSLTKTDYTFAGWNTQADGSGINYNIPDVFSMPANNVILYAQWTSEPPPTTTYTVTYNGNNNTGGSAPIDGSSPYTYNSPVTILGNTGSLVKTGYTFSGWNTQANGSGINYNIPDVFSMPTSNITLYAQWTPTYTVIYNGNTNTGGSAPIDGSSPYIAGYNVAVLGNTGSLVKTGYTFSGWNTQSNGSGINYNSLDVFTMPTNNVILYAKWTAVPTTYTLTYDGNINTSGSVPAGPTTYNSGSTVTVLGNTGSPVLAKTGYQFAGWNTEANGSGTNFVGGNTFTMPSSNTTLYAQWIIGGARLVYNANSAAGGTGTVPSSSGTYYTAFSTQPAVGNTGSFTNTNGYTFGGWNTLANGTGTSYPVGSNVTMPGSGTVTLYAQWINPATTYTLTYNAGTGGSGTAPIGSPVTYNSNATATILGNTGPYTNSDPTKTFYGWNTLANGTGTSYPAGSSLTMTANTNLYAQWVSNVYPYTVTYDANGATGGSVPAATTNYPSGVQVPILGQGSLTRSGYTFLGWNSSPTGAGSLYSPGYTFASQTTTLYALWAPGSSVKNCGGGTTSGGSGATSITYIFPYAQIIKSTDTITIFTTALLGTTTSNYGSGAAPLGIISITSKTIITQATIQINVNTSYSNSANDYNYAKTITNVTDVTYWPVGATISSITYANLTPSNSSSPPTYSISTQTSNNGCGLSVLNTNATYNFFNQSFTLNFSNGTNTFIATSPNNVFYTANSGISWTNAPRTYYPYALIVPNSDNALTTISITPSSGSQYVYPPLPNYTVEYNGNGSTSGSLPVPQYMSPYTATTTITIGGNTGSLAKTGVTFSRWNTAANGSGTNYGPGYTTTYNGGASITLYAIWV